MVMRPVIHTLRHSFATQGVKACANLLLIGKALGHTQAATTHRYAQAEQNPPHQIGNAVDAGLQLARERLQTKEAEEAVERSESVSNVIPLR